MYVMRSNLSGMASSLFSRLIVVQSHKEEDIGRGVPGTLRAATRAATRRSGVAPPIPSLGGQNRYIAISVLNGAAYCVGEEYQDEHRRGEWVEWRPFMFESIARHFKGAHYRILSPTSNASHGVASYAEEAASLFAEDISEHGEIHSDVILAVSRESIARKIVDVANAVAAFHTQGRIHGDLKPQNILLAEAQVSLIDEFGIEDGNRVPGWTPGWSAPEQVTGDRVSFSADIYPLGVMISRLLGGVLVGEARNYFAPDWPNRTSRHVILYDPSLYLWPQSDVLVAEEVDHWADFVELCLKFDPKRRLPSASEFAERLSNLIEQHPPRGDVEIKASEMPLFAARLPDGTDAIARVLTDETDALASDV